MRGSYKKRMTQSVRDSCKAGFGQGKKTGKSGSSIGVEFWCSSVHSQNQPLTRAFVHQCSLAVHITHENAKTSCFELKFV